VREESHLDDMRAAIRGDFARLKERIGDQALLVAEGADEVDATPGQEPPAQAEAQAPEAPPQAVVESDPDPEAPAGEVEVVEPVVGDTEPEPEAELEPDAPAAEAEVEPEPDGLPATRSWLDRLLGRG
jgi:hypothetical protein